MPDIRLVRRAFVCKPPEVDFITAYMLMTASNLYACFKLFDSNFVKTGSHLMICELPSDYNGGCIQA